MHVHWSSGLPGEPGPQGPPGRDGKRSMRSDGSPITALSFQVKEREVHGVAQVIVAFRALRVAQVRQVSPDQMVNQVTRAPQAIQVDLE